MWLDCQELPRRVFPKILWASVHFYSDKMYYTWRKACKTMCTASSSSIWNVSLNENLLKVYETDIHWNTFAIKHIRSWNSILMARCSRWHNVQFRQPSYIWQMMVWGISTALLFCDILCRMCNLAGQHVIILLIYWLEYKWSILTLIRKDMRYY
jgi:hypothetical protein